MWYRVLALLSVFMLMGFSVSAQTPGFVPGQVLLKFADGTRGHEAVVTASRVNRVDLAALADVIEQLGSQTGIPLKATSVGSGNWLVVSADTVALAERLMTWLSARGDVRAVEKRRSDGSLLATVSDGTEARDALRAAQAGAPESLGRLLDSWSVECGVPIMGQPTGTADLAIRVNLARVTLDQVAKLQALPEIASVQPNYAQTRRQST
jgi:hypothetical protein